MQPWALIVGCLIPFPISAAIYRQTTTTLVAPLPEKPTAFVNALPAAVDVTPAVVRPVSASAREGAAVVSGSAVVSASRPVSATLRTGLAAPGQCLAGLRVIAEMALVGYGANPNRSFMRVASHAAVAEPYAANSVPPNLKGLEAAIGDLPLNGAAVKEIRQTFTITKTACAGIVKAQ